MPLDELLKEHAEPLGVDGFGQVIVGTVFHRCDGSLDAALGREHHEGQLAQVIGEGSQERQTVAPWHDQVGEYDVRALRRDLLECVLAVHGPDGVETPCLDEFDQSRPGRRVVLGNQNTDTSSFRMFH